MATTESLLRPQAADFARYIKPVARRLLGEPNQQLSTPTQLRFGSHGSVAVDIRGEKAGTWFDHERNTGGGVVDLVARETGLTGQHAVEWLRAEVKADIPDNGRQATPRPAPERQKSAASSAPAERRQEPKAPAEKPRLAATYDYLTADGELQFQVCRMEPKTFRQRRPDPENPGGWLWTVKGMDLVPYRLPELLAADPKAIVFVCEGEKDVDALRAIGLVATCNAAGAGKWYDACTEALRGRHVVILPDNDPAGVNHAALVAAKLRGAAKTCRTLPLPGLPEKGDVSDWLAAGGTADKLRAMVAPEAQPDERTFGRLKLRSVQDLVNAPAREYLLEGLLAPREFSVWWGAPKCGKSFLLLRIAYGVALGLPMWAREAVRCPVLYVAAEGEGGIGGRLEALEAQHGVAADFHLIAQSVDLFNEDADLSDLIEAARHVGARLLVLDTLARVLVGGDENATRDMSAFVRNIDRLREEADVHVAVVHHGGHQGNHARGSIALVGAADLVVKVEKLHGANVATVTHAKDDESGMGLAFTMGVVDLKPDAKGRPRTTCLAEGIEGVVPAGPPPPRKLNDEAEALRRHITDLFAEGAGREMEVVAGGPTVLALQRHTLNRRLIERGWLQSDGLSPSNSGPDRTSVLPPVSVDDGSKGNIPKTEWNRLRKRLEVLQNNGLYSFTKDYVWLPKPVGAVQ